jgi:NAD(P) transhydrogenase subunit alpha
VLAGAMLIAVTAHNAVGYVILFLAAAFAAANVVGGYAVTGRMLKMFRKRPAAPAGPGPAAVPAAANGSPAATAGPPETQGPSWGNTASAGNAARHASGGQERSG